jgi:ribonuclease Z
MRLAGYDVDALSIGGIETCIQFPELDLAFDIGRCPHAAVKRRRLFVTHTHMDHAGGLAYHAATRDLYKLPPPTWYVPRENLADLEDMLAAFRRLDRSDLPVTLVPCGPGDELDLGRGWVARPFRSPHRVACQGYALCRRRTRLRADLQGLPEAAVRDRRLAGEAVAETLEAVEIAFTGDTLPEVIDREALVRQARLLVMECTFLDDRVPVEKARGSGHIHLDELIPRLSQLACETLLLTHFSARYSDAQITSILQKRLPAPFRERAVPLLAGRADAR